MYIDLNFYVYAYCRKSNGTPYYIGKGKNDRAYNKSHRVKVPKDKTKIVIMESNLSEVGALALERFYIKWYGRKDLGTGILINITDGGDGTSGYRRGSPSRETRQKISNTLKNRTLSHEHIQRIGEASKKRRHSEKTKQKMSENMKGNKHSLGHLHSEESKQKMRDKQLDLKPIICPHCNKIGKGGAMTLWHFDNCKEKGI